MDLSGDDRKLIQRFFEHSDEQSLQLLFGRYMRPIHSFLLRLTASPQDADDLTQETFLKVWKNLKRFKQDQSFKSWLFSIAHHTAIDWFRKRRNVPFSSFEDDEGNNVLFETLKDDVELPWVFLDRKDAVDILRKVLFELPPSSREILILRHESEMTFEEIGEILHEPLNTVKSRYRRSLLILRERFLALPDDNAPKITASP